LVIEVLYGTVEGVSIAADSLEGIDSRRLYLCVCSEYLRHHFPQHKATGGTNSMCTCIALWQ